MSVYVMSDVHGLKSRFDKLLKSLDFTKSDHLYIIGDVVDRGPDGMEILLECMHNENITLLMGNHEYMMLEVLKRSKQLAERTAMYDALKAIERWFRNGCRPTIEAYESLSEKLQMEVQQYLENCPLAICDLPVQDRCYYLVHAHPVMEFDRGIVTLDQLCTAQIEPDCFVWDRIQGYQSFFKAVSYTHLDVYKRQGKRRICIIRCWKSAMVHRRLTCMTGRRMPMETFISVMP